jgi:hypothetical protein
MNVSRPSRRTVLRGLGAAVALPWLEATATARAPSPRRLAFVYVPNGKIMKSWTPSGEGRGFSLSSTLAPLADFRNQLLVISGLHHRNGEALGDGAGDHARASGSYLTGVHPHKSATLARAGISVDQVAAQAIGHHTRLPSLELSCDRGPVAGSCDSGYSCAYENAISWRSETTPLPGDVDPRQVFDRLFGPPPDAATVARDRSVLDHVADDARRLSTSLGGADRRKLDEYFTSVRQVERQLVHAASSPPARLPRGVRRPPEKPGNYEHHVRLMCDLMVLALQTDSTRVVTLVLGREISNRTFPNLGAHEGHHDLSHHMNDPHKIAALEKIDRFYVERFAYLLARLREVKEGDGTLLDASLIMYGSGLSDGNGHEHHDLPTVMAGQGGGTVKSGRHLRLPDKTPMCNLFVGLLHRMGVAADRFGDSTGALAGLDAI